MTIRLGVTFDILTGEFERQMAELEEPMARAGTLAVRQVADEVKVDGRADIASAGFGRKWQNTLRVDVFPKSRSKFSLSAAAFIWHRIVYAGVFEEGARISGKPFMWVPLATSPRKIGRNRMTPRNFTSLVGPLVSMNTSGPNPLLGARVRLSKAASRRPRPKLTLAALKRGASGEKGVLRTVPVFVGIRSANIPDKFSIAEITKRGRDRLAAAYVSNLRPDE